MSEKTAAIEMAPQSSPKLVAPKTLFERITQIHNEIERRAFEIFKDDGGLWGHDLDHWFKAERELLHPASVNIAESENSLNVQVEVPGFTANELEVSVEGRRLVISGKRETSKEEKEKGKPIYKEQCSDQLLRVFGLPVEVDAGKATAKLKNGILELEIPKSAQAKPTRVEVKAAA